MAHPLRWGTATTLRAPPEEIARFVAFHLALGCDHMSLYLDEPDADIGAEVTDDPRVSLIRCTDAHWQSLGVTRPAQHQSRQDLNATHAYRRSDLDWLAHIDIDEFLLTTGSVAAALSRVPPQERSARAAPVELLCGPSAAPGMVHFKRHLSRNMQLGDLHLHLFPQFGADIPNGFLSHVAGKVFVRPGLSDVTVGIHRARIGDGNQIAPHPLRGVLLGHCHARSREDFIARARFRLNRGAYRPLGNPRRARISALLKRQMQADGDAGLAAVFDEFCATRPALLTGLEANALLLSVPHHPALTGPA